MNNLENLYPRTGDIQTIYLKNAISHNNIEVGDFTMYNNFVNAPNLVSYLDACRVN